MVAHQHQVSFHPWPLNCPVVRLCVLAISQIKSKEELSDITARAEYLVAALREKAKEFENA